MGNSLRENIQNRYVILKKKHYKGEKDIERMFYCEGGFGCSKNTMGTAVFGHFIIDGETCRVDGTSIKRFATDKEIEKGKKIEGKVMKKIQRKNKIKTIVTEKIDDLEDIINVELNSILSEQMKKTTIDDIEYARKVFFGKGIGV